MKTLGINKTTSLFLKLVCVLSFVSLTACDDGGSGLSASQHPHLPPAGSIEACRYQQQNQFFVGIPGNPHCPYQGQAINGQVEAFAQINFNAGFEIDFGLQYNDACPPGQMPVYEHIQGNLIHTRCDNIGGSYVDNVFFQHHNISNCAGAFAGDKRCIPNPF